MPSASTCPSVRPPTRSRASSTTTSSPAADQPPRGGEPGEPGAHHDHGHAATSAARPAARSVAPPLPAQPRRPAVGQVRADQVGEPPLLGRVGVRERRRPGGGSASHSGLDPVALGAEPGQRRRVVAQREPVQALVAPPAVRRVVGVAGHRRRVDVERLRDPHRLEDRGARRRRAGDPVRAAARPQVGDPRGGRLRRGDEPAGVRAGRGQRAVDRRPPGPAPLPWSRSAAIRSAGVVAARAAASVRARLVGAGGDPAPHRVGVARPRTRRWSARC